MRTDRTLGGIQLGAIARGLEMGPEGFWISRNVGAISYPEDGNRLCFSVEDESFWFRHRNNCILEALARFPPPGTLFDVGGGNGFVARAIQQSGQEVVLVEPGPEGVRNALQRGVTNVIRATLEDADFLLSTLPAVGLFDVVEHIEEARGFLGKLRLWLTPGGRVYLTVPAYQWLWSGEDVSAGHARRYTISRLRRLLKSAGYEVEFASYFFSFLPLPILLRRALPYRLGFRAKRATEDAVRSEHNLNGGMISSLLQNVTSWESSRIARLKPLWTGGSCLAIARKPASS